MMNVSLAFVAAGFAMGVAAVGTAWSIGHLAGKAVEGIARQPEAGGSIRTTMIIATAFIEAIALYTFVISILLTLK
ncbi:MAG: ATP synthase F0 subunit C [Actinobacteria bacterium]|nr:ATP synthase F0 subunit C [Actinomycetota bacterium]